MMGFLVQDLLDYAQIKSGNFRKNEDLFDIREAVTQVMTMQMKKAQEMKIKFYPIFHNISESDSGMNSPLICTDKKRVMQVLLNLQSNALKFTLTGSVIIVVKILENENEEQFLKISVKDTGVGIPYKDQDKLFKLFGFVKTT